jgi:uncharacterized protein (DUF2267 family)
MSNDSLWASTIQKSNLLLKELSEELGYGAEDTLLTFRTIMHGLRDRLPLEEAVHLAAQLPLLLKGVYYDGWKPAHAPVKVKNRVEFYGLVAPALERGIRDVDVPTATHAVLSVLADHLSEGEVEQIRGILPEGLRDLWPAKATA